MEDDWTDDIEEILSKVRQNCIDMYKYHLYRYFQYKRVLPIFRVPVLILNALNSVFSVGLQPYMEQGLISVLNCLISLIATLINSIEMYMGIQKSMETEMTSSQGFYILSIGIYKMLTLTRENRDITGKQYLTECYNTYSELVRNSKLIKDPHMLQKDFLQNVDTMDGRTLRSELLGGINNFDDLAFKTITSGPSSSSSSSKKNMSTNQIESVKENSDIENGIPSISLEKAIENYLIKNKVVQKAKDPDPLDDMYPFSRHNMFGGNSRQKSFLEIAGATSKSSNYDEIPTLDVPNQLFGNGGVFQNMFSIHSNPHSQHSVNSTSTYVDNNHSNHLFDILQTQVLPRTKGVVELSVEEKKESSEPSHHVNDSNTPN